MLPLPTAFLFTAGQVEFQLARVRSILSVNSPGAASVFRRQGSKWVVSFEGETIYPKSSVGMIYIARLLAEPYRDIPAVMLHASRSGINPQISRGSSGEVLTNETRKIYRRRREDLLEDIEEAKKNNDFGRAEKLQEEIEFLNRELASAAGLGGRSRQKSDIERIRKSVSTGVSRAIEAIEADHETLGRRTDCGPKIGDRTPRQLLLDSDQRSRPHAGW